MSKKIQYPEPGQGVAVVTSTEADIRREVALEILKLLLPTVNKPEDATAAVRRSVQLADQFLGELERK